MNDCRFSIVTGVVYTGRRQWSVVVEEVLDAAAGFQQRGFK